MNTLGKGAYGYVIEDHGVAIKTFLKLPHIIQEYGMLKYLNDCKYIVHTTGIDFENKALSMTLYKYSLRKWMNDDDCCCCQDCLKLIIHDVLCGLVELQDRGLSHSDIKPGNILISNKPLKAVLGDCGFVSIAKYSKQQRTAQTYRDIHVVNDLKHDMFSLGIMMMELFYRIKPTVRDKYKDYYNVIDKRVKHEKYRNLFKSLLNEKRELRPTARDVLQLLYHETPDHIILKQHVGHFNDVFKKYNKEKIDELELFIKHHYKQLYIKRSKRGFKALLYFLSKNDVVSPKLLKFYLAATLMILSSIFGNHSPILRDIVSMCDLPEHNRKKLLHIIDLLIKDDGFMLTLMS
ncbi:MAG TPA: protein kinase [Candidatus Saccharimonadales bacterium]|nr:protein kinase [Candidatus Saccharimonadales bacterium]